MFSAVALVQQHLPFRMLGGHIQKESELRWQF